jgi:hypothetical protein
MKRIIPIEIILALVLIGIAIGFACSRWAVMETQIANHNERLAFLEGEHKKRFQFNAYVRPLLDFAVRCFQKATFGYLKLQ